VSTPIYLDNLATTRLAPEVRDAMLPWLDEGYGNASSSTHWFGWAALDAVDQARDEVADLLGVHSSQIVFTSGATESNNTVIKGIYEAFAGSSTHVVTTAIEHPSVLVPCEFIAGRGASVTFVLPGADGIVDPDEIVRAIRPDTRLVTVMAANNEIGTLQPLMEIGHIARSRGILFHVDAAQAIAKTEVNIDEAGIDFLSLSGHKFHGPKGIGALYLAPDVVPGGLPALLHGGGQEGGRRAGTLPVAQIVGLGVAARIAIPRWRDDARRARELTAMIWERLTSNIDGVLLNGSRQRRLPNCLNLSADDVSADALIAAAPELALSSGSACSSQHGGGSHVLAALGVSPACQRSAFRLCVSRYTTAEDIETAAAILIDAVQRIREGLLIA
jgi:cysteine desulfurase